MENNLLDELTLVNEDEKTFSTKVLAILGGVTSFGALFPMFLSNLSLFTDIKDPYWPFKIFMAIYFLLPLIVLFSWLFLSRRAHLLGNPDPTISKASRSFFIILGVQFILGLVLIFNHANRVEVIDSFKCAAVYSCLLLFTLYCFFKPIYRVSKVVGYAAVAVTVLGLLLMLLAVPKYVRDSIEHDGADTSRRAYLQLDRLDKLKGELASMGQKTKSATERFRLQSRMRWVANDVDDSLEQKFSEMAKDSMCLGYVMKPYIAFFYELVLSKDIRPIGFDSFMIITHLNGGPYEGKGNLFNAREIHRQYEAEKWKPDTSVKPAETIFNSVAYIPVIADAIDTALSNSLVVSLGSFETGVIDTLLAKQHLSTNDTQLKVRFAHYLNEENSRSLYAWIGDFIVDVEKTAQHEETTIKKNVAWILRDAQVKGLFIFITLLMNILLFCCVILSTGIILKQKARELALKVVNKEDAETLKNFLDTRLRLIQLYLFPVVTFVAIVIALLIPLMKPINVLEINASKPGWFLSLSNWNVAGAITETIKELPISNSAKDNAKAETGGVTETPGSAPPSILDNEGVTKEEFREAVDTITKKIDAASHDAKAVNDYLRN